MASQATMTHALRRLAQAFDAYALAQGWKREDYRTFVRINEDWGQIHVIFVARAFPGKHLEGQWSRVWDFVERELEDDPGLAKVLHLVLRTFDEVAEGGLYAIGPDYAEVNDLLPVRPLVGK